MPNILPVAALLAVVATASSLMPNLASAQALDPQTGAPFVPPVLPAPDTRNPALSREPTTTFACQPGQVLNALGDPCRPTVTLPPPHPSLRPMVPNLRPEPQAPTLFYGGSNCPPGQVLQESGEPCAAR